MIFHLAEIGAIVAIFFAFTHILTRWLKERPVWKTWRPRTRLQFPKRVINLLVAFITSSISLLYICEAYLNARNKAYSSFGRLNALFDKELLFKSYSSLFMRAAKIYTGFEMYSIIRVILRPETWDNTMILHNFIAIWLLSATFDPFGLGFHSHFSGAIILLVTQVTSFHLQLTYIIIKYGYTGSFGDCNKLAFFASYLIFRIVAFGLLFYKIVTLVLNDQNCSITYKLYIGIPYSALATLNGLWFSRIVVQFGNGCKRT